MLIEILVSVLVLVGASFALIGSFGLLRLPDFFMRLHGPTKATTLGVGTIVVASLIVFNVRGGAVSLGELAIPGFLFLTAPVVAHVVAKAARSKRD